MKKVNVRVRMRSIKMIAFLLAAFMVLPVVASCKKGDEKPLDFEEIVALLSKYTVVYSELRDEEQNKMIYEAATAIKDAYGLEMTADFVMGDVPQDNVEILVGATNRNASSEALSVLSSFRKNFNNDYIIKCTTDKIVIVGGSTRATVAATKYFLETVVPTFNKKNIENFEYVYRADISVTEIAGISATDYSICIGNSDYLSDIAIQVQSAMISATGYEMPIVKARKLESPAAIYIGATGASAYDAVVSELEGYRENHLEDWTIKANGSGIVVAFTSDLALETAVTYFYEKVLPLLASNKGFSDYTYRKEYSEVTLAGVDIKNYSIAAYWDLAEEQAAPSDSEKYTEDTEERYCEWLQAEIFDKTGYILPIIDYNTENKQIIKIAISHQYYIGGGIEFVGDDFLIYGSRYASAAGAMADFVDMITESNSFDANFTYNYSYDTAIVVDGLYPTVDNVLDLKDKRPVPTEFEVGEGGHRGSDGLVYYPMPEDAETVVSRLQGGELIMDANDWYSLPTKSSPNGGNPSADNYGDYEIGGFQTSQGIGQFATIERVTVSDSTVPFNEALRINVISMPDSTRNQYLNYRYYPNVADFGALFEDGDVMLVKIYAKLVSGGDIATATGMVNLSFSKYWASQQTAANKESGMVTLTPADDGWYTYYMAFSPTHQYISDGFCFSFDFSCVQEVLIGGFELVNYGKAYTMDDMPLNVPIHESMSEGAEWREDALARIEQVRKGDIKVVVQDANGNRIEGADIKVDMFEHEISLGIQFSGYYLKYDRPDAAKYREAIVKNFNSWGFAALHKLADDNGSYLDYDLAEEAYYWAMLNGCAQELKGHALFWDQKASAQIPSANGNYTSTIDYYMQFVNANDWDGLNRAIEAHFEWMSIRFPYLTQWDVSNEDSSRNEGNRDYAALKKAWVKYLQDQGKSADYISEHTYDYLIPIYEYARQYFPEAELVVNDIYSYDATRYESIQLPFLEWAYNNLDFDTIGYQGHEGYGCDPAEVVKIMDDLSQFGYDISITEFDTAATGGLNVNPREDPDYQANLVRDCLIAYFACENVTSIYFWWPKDVGSSAGSILFDYLYNPTKAGLMFQDLFYNQWWTNEQGTTGADGTFSTRGFYGEYTVTASKDGKTASVDAVCYKGMDNTVVITLK